MPTRNVKSKGLFSFGTGVAVGFGAGLAMKVFFPKAIKLPGLILEKLGFEVSDLLNLFWNPDDSLDGVALPVRKVAARSKKRRKAPRARRVVKTPERFVLEPVVSAAAVRDAWRKVPASTRRASGLRLEVETPHHKRRKTRAAVRFVKPRPARGRVLAGVN